MKISVITLTYNNFQELINTINSVPDLSFIEKVIVNGGSDSQTEEYLKDFNGIVVTGKDEGIADAFNKGILASTGEALMFLNSGDILINPAYLTTAHEKLNDANVNFTHADIVYIDEAAGEIVMKPANNNPGRGMLYLHPTMIAKKSLFNLVGMFNKSYRIAMDYDWVIRLEKGGIKGTYIKTTPVVKMEGGGISSSREYSAIMECYRSLKQNKFLTLYNIAGFLIRLSLLYFRTIVKKIGGDKGLKKLKLSKYKEN